ncbi:MAG: hypothetical protein CL530_11480 [Aequorivita sp.]|nr:hypothetical protein [Aequorivita sp.]
MFDYRKNPIWKGDFPCLLVTKSSFLIVFTTLLAINFKTNLIMSKPSNCITVAAARQLQDNWVATRAVDIERAMGSGDTREFLFSVAELEQFLAYVKAGSGSMNPGIRIYFGAYDNATSDKATVFLAPTMGVTPGVANDYSLEPLNKGITGFPPKNY